MSASSDKLLVDMAMKNAKDTGGETALYARAISELQNLYETKPGDLELVVDAGGNYRRMGELSPFLEADLSLFEVDEKPDPRDAPEFLALEEKLDELVGDIENANTKTEARQALKKLDKVIKFDAFDKKDIDMLLKDRDMTVDDIMSTVNQAVETYKAKVLEVSLAAQLDADLKAAGFDPDVQIIECK